MKSEDVKVGMKVTTHGCDAPVTVKAVVSDLAILSDDDRGRVFARRVTEFSPLPPQPPPAPQYEYVEIVVEHFGPRTVCKYRDCGATTFLEFAPRYGAVGYLFDVDGERTIQATPVAYKRKGGKALLDYMPATYLESGKAEAVYATHVVFRKEA